MMSDPPADRGKEPHEAVKAPPVPAFFVPQPAADEEQTPAAWTARALGALAGVLAALLFLLAAAPHLRPVYHSYDGVVGPPAFSDRAPETEIRLYGLGLFLCAGLGGWGGMLARRSARRGKNRNLNAVSGIAAGAIVVECGLYLLARRMHWIPQSNVTALIKQIVSNPKILIQAMAMGGAVLALSYPGMIPVPPAVSSLSRRTKWRTPAELALFSRRFFPPFALLSVLLSAASPIAWAGLVLAFPLALLTERILRPAEIPRKGSHGLQALERAAWLVPSLAPGGLWLMRLGRTLHWPLPSPGATAGLAVAAAAVPIVVGWIRRSAGWGPALRPEKLLMPALASCLMLAGAELAGYDAFHQGEFTYPIQALRRGLLPWKDIFYIHGLGDDTLAGLFMGPPAAATHSLDLIFLATLSAAGVCLAMLLYLEVWGWSWWPAAFAFAALTVTTAGWANARFLLVWISLLLARQFLLTRRLRWLGLAGVAGWLGVLYSLDIGAMLGLGIGLWTVVWGVAFGGKRDAFQNPLHRHWPALAFSIGALSLACVTALVLWRLGILRETLVLHAQYALVKPHYDKFPFELNFLSAIAGPAASALGIWAGYGIIRRREDGPLAGLILLLTILNILCWMRTLDRADVGHIAYGSMMTWPLLGSLAVWQARRGHFPHWPSNRAREAAELLRAPNNMIRAIAVAAFLIAFPYASPPLVPFMPEGSVGASTVFPAGQIVQLFSENARLPLLGSVTDPLAKAFFDEARQLGELTKAPGPWSTKIVRTFYDFSNQPGFYVWTGLTAPNRYFTTHYPSSETWQRETIDALGREKVKWVMWRGPDAYWNRPDGTSDNPQGMPNWLHEWRIAQYLLRNYRPATRLATEGTTATIAGLPKPVHINYDALVLERTAESAITTETQPLEPMWLEPVELGEVPTVWGRGGKGAPAFPGKIVMQADLKTSEGEALMIPDDPMTLLRASEVDVTFDPPVEGRCLVSWENAAGESEFRTIEFGIHEALAGPYRLPVSSSPTWTWGGAPVKLTVKLSNGGAIRRPIGIRFEARAE